MKHLYNCLKNLQFNSIYFSKYFEKCKVRFLPSRNTCSKAERVFSSINTRWATKKTQRYVIFQDILINIYSYQKLIIDALLY